MREDRRHKRVLDLYRELSSQIGQRFIYAWGGEETTVQLKGVAFDEGEVRIRIEGVEDSWLGVRYLWFKRPEEFDGVLRRAGEEVEEDIEKVIDCILEEVGCEQGQDRESRR